MFDPASRLIELTGPRPRLAVAFSGGIDSTVLVHALARQRRKFNALRLLHVDHGLQATSAAWSRHCARIARSLRLDFVALNADIQPARGVSPEAAARDARYTLLMKALAAGEVLVTAQHRDDQVETLLLQLFRGAGVAGLAAMPPIAPFGAGRIARPLLAVPRADLETFARRLGLRWIEDPSNELVRFDRNFLRHRVLPEIRARWKGVDEAVARSARHMAEAAALLDERARGDLARASDGDGLSVAALRSLPAARRRNALRAFIAMSGCELPSTAKLAEIAGPLLAARLDAQPQVEWSAHVMRRRGGRLQLEAVPHARTQNTTAVKSWNWRQQRELRINGSGKFTLRNDVSGAIDLDRLPGRLEVRARRGGERLRPGIRAREKSLKKLLQAAKLTVEQRASLPLLYAGDRLVAAGDRWIDASIMANDKSRRRARLAWTHSR